MTVDLVFRIAAIGLLTSLMAQVLARAGREEIGTLVTLAGLAVALLMVVDLIRELFESMRSVFLIY